MNAAGLAVLGVIFLAVSVLVDMRSRELDQLIYIVGILLLVAALVVFALDVARRKGRL